MKTYNYFTCIARMSNALALTVVLSLLYFMAAAQPQHFNYTTTLGSNSFPFNVTTGKQVQWFVAPGEFVQPGPVPGGNNITTLWFWVNGNGNALYNNFTVKLGQTSSGFAGGSFYSGSLTTVVGPTAKSLITASSTWLSIPLDVPFLYDPSQWLVIDVSQCGYTGIGFSVFQNTFATPPFRRAWSVGGCPLVWSNNDGTLPGIGVSVTPAAPCVEPPTPGTAIATAPSVCAGATVGLNLTGTSFGSGQTYQWQSDPLIGGTYSTNVGGVLTSPFLNINPASTLFYRCAVTCGSTTLFSTPVLVTAISGLSGTFTIDNTLPTGGTNFQSFTHAVNALSCGLTAAVVFNVTAGQTFNENVPPITVNSDNVRTITFQKSGAGANPVIVPTGSTLTTDAGITISGSDFITFDGIDIMASGAAVENGFRIAQQANTNGAQNNTIKNCAITLNRTNTNSRGIFQTATLTPSSALGANSNNTYQNLTIKNVYAGIQLTGIQTSTFPDINNKINTSGCGTMNIIGDPVTNFDIGGGITAIQTWGIRLQSQAGFTVSNNLVSNVSGNTTTDGILIETYIGVAGNLVSTLSNNVVNNVKINLSVSTQVSGIRLSHTTLVVPAGTALNVFNNSVSGITSAYAGGALTLATTTGIKGIVISGSGGSTVNQTYEIYNNSVSIDGSSSLNLSNACFQITATAGTGPKNIVRNNIFANFTGTQVTSRHVCFFTSSLGSATAMGPAGSAVNNNDLFVANGAGVSGFIGQGSTTGYNPLATWQTTYTQATANMSGNPLFFSNSANLHVANDVLLNGTAFATMPSYITVDLDCQARTAPHDVGAYNVNACVSGVPTASVSPLGTSCAGQLLTATTNASSPNYQWLKDGINTGLTSSSITPTAIGNYSVLIWNTGESCVATSNSVNVITSPVLSVTPASASVCDGQSVNLLATLTPPPGQIGTGALVNTTTTYPAPYGNWFWGSKHQMLITAAEMSAANLTAGNITAVAFNVTGLTTTPLQNFTIAIGHSALGALTTIGGFQAGLTTVFGPVTYTPVLGSNNHVFTVPFNWNGSSNVIVEVCFNNTSFTTNCVVTQTATPFTSTIYRFADAAGQCTAAPTTQVAQRPNMVFTAQSTIPFVWTPATGLSNANIHNPVATPPAGTTVYTVSVTLGGCTGTASTSLTNIALPPAPSATAANQVCGFGTVTLNAVGTGTPGWVLRWYSAPSGGSILATGGTFVTPEISVTTTFYVAEFNGTCESLRTPVNAVSITPTPVNVTNTIPAICDGATTPSVLTASSTNANYAYQWTPTGGLTPSDGLGASVQAFPAATTTYLLTATDNTASPACLVKINTTVGIGQTPSFLGVTATPSALCTGEPSTLNAVAVLEGTPGVLNGFIGPFAPATWTTQHSPGDLGSVSVFNATTLTMISSDGGAGPSDIDVIHPITANGNVSFSWNYSTVDGANWDQPQFYKNGIRTNVPGFSTIGGTVQSGTAVIPVVVGDVFGFTMHSVDNVAGPATTTFNNVVFPVPAGSGGIVYTWTPAATLNTTTGATVIATPLTGGSNVYTVTASNNGCTSTSSVSVNATQTPPAPVTTGTTLCGQGMATVSATTTGGTLLWTESTGGPIVGTGTSYSEYIAATKQFSVRENPGGITQNVGLLSNAPGLVAYASASLNYQTFNVMSPKGIIINTVDIVPNFATPLGTPIEMVLENNLGVQMGPALSFVTTTQGTVQTLTLNMFVPQGTAYRLRASKNPNMQYHQSGFLNPYTIPGQVSITGWGPPDATTLYVFFYNWNITIACIGPSSTATATVTPAPPLTVSPASGAFCNSGSVPLTAGGPSYVNFSWSPAAGLNTAAGASVIASPAVTTEYIVTADDGLPGGCIDSQTVVINVHTGPILTITQTAPFETVCLGYSFPLNAQGASNSFKQFGNERLSVNNQAAVLYNGGNASVRSQMLYTAAELIASGLVPGNLSAIGWEVATKLSTGTYSGFTIKMANVANTTLTATYLNPAFTTVFVGNIQTTLGWNTHTLTTPFAWDGLSSVLVDVCNGTGPPFGFDQVYTSPTVGNQTINITALGCAAGAGAATNRRPNTRIYGGGVTFAWTPTVDLSSATVPNPVYTSTSTGVKVYTVTATDPSNSCTSTASLTFEVSTTPRQPIAVVTSSDDEFCFTGIPMMTVTNTTGNYQWESSLDGINFTPVGGATGASFTSAAITVTTYYRVAVECTGPIAYSNVLQFVVNDPAISSTTPSTPICGFGNVCMSATANNPLYDVKWYAAPSGGQPLSTGNTFCADINTTTTFYAAAVSPGGSPPVAVPMPAQNTTFTGNVRGYWFTSPVTFTISGLQVIGTPVGPQSIAVIRFNPAVPPPAFPTTTNAFTTLFLTQNNVATGVIPVNITVNAGDVIGILGQRATTTPYGPLGPQVVTIAGQPVTLTRMGMQFFLTTTAPQQIWTEPGANIGLIQMTVGGECASPRVPVVAVSNPAPAITVTPSHNMCEGVGTTLTATSANSGYDYTWNPGNLIGGTQFVTPTVNTTYTVIASDNSSGPNAGCNISATTTVTVKPVPVVNVTNSNPVICNPGASPNSTVLTGNVTNAGPSAVTFSNTSNITINDGTTATPYPSNITVSGLSASSAVQSVTLFNLSHTFVSDIDVLLVSPTGTVMLMSDAGGGGPGVVNVTYTFQNGSPAMPSTPPPTGTYAPTNIGTGDGMQAPAPLEPYGTTLAGLGNTNGTWSLYVHDDAGADIGNFAGGWSITFSDNQTFTFTWTPVTGLTGLLTGSVNGNSPTSVTANPTADQMYAVTFTNPTTGCSTSATTTVTANKTPVIVSLQSATLSGGVPANFPNPPTFLDIPEFTTATTCDEVVNYNLGITAQPSATLNYTFSGATLGSGSGSGSGSTFGRLIPTGRTTVVVNATNVCGSHSRTFRVTITDNVVPVITPLQVSATNTNGGECASNVQVTQPDLANGGLFDNCPNSSLIFVSRSDGRSQFEQYFAGTTTVTWQATDASANTTIATQDVVVNNIKPVITSFTPAEGSLIFVNQTATFTAEFTDEDGGGTHTVKFYRDKNDAVPANVKTMAPVCYNLCTGIATYSITSDPILFSSSQVLEPKVEVLDGCNLAADQNPGVSTYMYLAVAVPGNQFTTAGGHFTVPAGAHPSSYEGFNVSMGNIVKKATTGNSFKGQLEMNVHIPGLPDWRVHTDNGTNNDITWDYLTIAGCSLATFKGSVRINGQTGYKILVQQSDKDRNPATSNFIRVKVSTNGGVLIFDTQPGLTEALTSGNGGAAAIIVALDNGSIKVQPSSTQNQACTSRIEDSETTEGLINIPNPFSAQTEIRFSVPEDGKYTLKVYNYLGEIVANLFDDQATSGTVYKVTFDASNLGVGIYTYTLSGVNMNETRRMNLIR